MFKDRFEAAVKLAAALDKYKNEDGIVLAVPRGGVPLGYVIAKELHFPLELGLSKKIGHPYNPEFAIGSVTLYGTMVNDNMIDVDPMYIKKETLRIVEELKKKYKYYTGNGKTTDLKNKIVIIVDDGVATGSTMLAIIEVVKKQNPQKIIIAVPVAPFSTAQKLREKVDELVCLETPEFFIGVGQFYDDFSQVSDEEVIQLLRNINSVEGVQKHNN